MFKPLPSLVIGNSLVTVSEQPEQSSRPVLTPTQREAAETVDRLFDLLPPQDVGNPESFLIAAAVLFSQYTGELGRAAAFEIAQRSDRPTLKLMREVLDEFSERAMTQQNRAERERRLPPPARAPRTPEEQARIDEQVTQARRAFGLPPQGLQRAG